MSVHKPKICLACSAGGHLRELQLAIGDIPNNWNCYWLTLKTTSTKAFMKDKEHVFLVNFQPAKKWSLIINCIQAIFWVLIKRPNVIITTGAGVAVPTVFFAKKLLKSKVIFINSAITFHKTLSSTKPKQISTLLPLLKKVSFLQE